MSATVTGIVNLWVLALSCLYIFHKVSDSYCSLNGADKSLHHSDTSFYLVLPHITTSCGTQPCKVAQDSGRHSTSIILSCIAPSITRCRYAIRARCHDLIGLLDKQKPCMIILHPGLCIAIASRELAQLWASNERFLQTGLRVPSSPYRGRPLLPLHQLHSLVAARRNHCSKLGSALVASEKLTIQTSASYGLSSLLTTACRVAFPSPCHTRCMLYHAQGC